ncbi:16S rRNA (uracil(1498)-N(3))-methyltransferase [Mycetocola spongiae]|uniref:16S rRNA (uracil(1498)-N(3))-methyltransferase n=1 Tax=Mycetocola spongiae TaxID=2859226 RepID=UPI001CF21808|nr:16S rRNA (uracil(1498)-N(3))-methyltransferase [Mycetocola spongiae]UCR89432.1 16S rRNA (uracil(1498)-N(3))-methyltransferase [Mycetocola spongiae]
MSSLFLREFPTVPAVGDSLTLTGPEAKHAVTVNRVRVGEELFLGDGKGIMVACTVTAVSPRELVAEATAVTLSEPDRPRLYLVQALAKGDRDEMAVQAATELGVAGVIPWAAERSISRWQGDKVAKGRARWETISREAAKQSIRAHLPEVREIVDLTRLCELTQEFEMLVLDPTAEVALTTYLVNHSEHTRPIALVIGPEGGISPRELALLDSAGARRVVLGNTILRTSTAGPAAMAVINAALGRW